MVAEVELGTTEEDDEEDSASRDMGATFNPSGCLSELIQGGVI